MVLTWTSGIATHVGFVEGSLDAELCEEFRVDRIGAAKLA